MHSSRMCTIHSSGHIWGVGVCYGGEWGLPWGLCVSHHPLRHTPQCAQTDTCENITFATSLWTVINTWYKNAFIISLDKLQILPASLTIIPLIMKYCFNDMDFLEQYLSTVLFKKPTMRVSFLLSNSFPEIIIIIIIIIIIYCLLILHVS